MKVQRHKKRKRLPARQVERLCTWGLLVVVGCYAAQQGEGLEQIRLQAKQVLFGDQSPAQVVATFGGLAQPVDNNTSTTSVQAVSGELGHAGDLCDIRAQALFPDTVDDTVYAIAFANPAPTVGVLSSPFGERISPTTGEVTFHYGLDIAAPQGTPICSLDAGVVVQVGESSYGNYIVVSHDNGTSALYAHCHTISATQGQVVAAGEEIAQVGSTGISTGNHLHVEIWRAGKVLNPMHYLAIVEV